MHYLLIISMLLMSGCLRQPDPMMQMLERIDRRMDEVNNQMNLTCNRFGNGSPECQHAMAVFDRQMAVIRGALDSAQGSMRPMAPMPALQPMKPAQICQGGVDAFGALCLP